MSTSRHTSIQVKDFGPIRRGRIELRPLTVFTGASHTGKSWLAMLLYALAQQFQPRRKFYSEEFGNEMEDAPNTEKLIDLKLNDLVADNCVAVSDSLTQFFEQTKEKRTKELEVEIVRTFGFQDIQQAINWRSKHGASIEVTSPLGGISETLSTMSIEIGKKYFRYREEHPETLNMDKLPPQDRGTFDRLKKYDRENHDDIERRFHERRTAQFLYRVLNNRFFPSEGTLYLPAGRVGLMDSFRTIVGGSMQGELDNVTTGQFGSRPLSGVIVDFLKKLTRISPNSETQQQTASSRLEHELLLGSIEIIHNQVGFPYFFFKPTDTEKLLPLNLSSSMVSQLAPIVLLVREISEKNNVIILEEPEVHLHPVQQVRFLQEISRWARGGNKVILITHSEWITEALSNLVMENKLDTKDGMAEEDVGLWRFIGGPKGSEINESVWNGGSGGYDDGLEEVGDQLLNEWTWYKEELS